MNESRLAQAFAPGSIAVQAVAADWREAVELAGNLLVQSGRTTTDYTGAMVAAIEELGPYIVIAPGVALAHARPSEAVLATGMSLVTLAKPVAFGNLANDPVSLVFALAAADQDSHIDLLQGFATLMSNPASVNLLLTSTSVETIRGLLAKPLQE